MKIFAYGAVAFALLASPAVAQTKKLVLGTEAAFAPFNMKAPDGSVTGFDTEIGDALCKQMKRECEWQVVNWDGIIPALLAKKIDAIVASMSITPERQQRVAFTRPYYQDAVQFMARKGSGLFAVTPDALKGKAIGTQRSSSQAAYLEDLYSGGSSPKFYDNLEQAAQDLVAKRIELVLSFRIPLNEWIAKAPEGSCCELVGPMIRDPKYFGGGAGIAVRKEDAELLREFGVALDAISANGTYAKVNAKYFPFDISPQ